MAQTPQPDDLAAAKKALRREAQRRRAAAAEAAPEAGRRLRECILATVPLPPACAVSGYWPMGGEMDPVPTLETLSARGHPVGLPVMAGRGRALVFRAWHPAQVLEDGGFGTRVPPADAPELRPQVLLVPLLAFDRTGYRLGYGGGFYDRTLQALRAQDPHVLAVGIAYAGQEVAHVPRGAGDQPLDMLVTEAGAVDLGRAGAGGA